MSDRRQFVTAAAILTTVFAAARVEAQENLFDDVVFGPQVTATDTEESRKADGVELGDGISLEQWLREQSQSGDPTPLPAPDRTKTVPEPTPVDEFEPSLTDLDKYPLLPEDDDLLMPRPADPTPSLRRPDDDLGRSRGDLPDWAVEDDATGPDVELLPAPTRRESNKPAVNKPAIEEEEDDLLLRDDLSQPLLVQPRGDREYNPEPIPLTPVLPRLPSPTETGPSLRPDDRPTVRQRTLRPQPAAVGTPEGIRLAIGGELLDTLFRNEQQRCGDVNDCVLGAQVRGRQQTRTRTSLRLRPCEEAARFEVVLDGRTLSETSGSTSVAAVRSSGDHRFEMVKPFRFDGDQIQTATPAATVWPQQTNLAAIPLRGRVPIVNRVVGRLAYQEAERRKPATERIAAQRLSRRVADNFNAAIDPVLSRLQSVWDDQMLARLESVMPTAKRPTARTTETHAVFKLPTPNGVEASADLPTQWPANADGVALAIHESTIVAALDRLSLEGRELPRGDWDGLVGRLLPKARVAKKPASDEDLSALGTLRLADSDPVSVRFDGGRAEIMVRGVVVTPIGETSVQRITIPWTVAADGDAVLLQPGRPDVVADEPDSRGAVDIDVMDRVRQLVEMTVAEEMRTVRLRRAIDLPVSDRTMRLSLSNLRMRNGWLLLTWNADVR